MFSNKKYFIALVFISSSLFSLEFQSTGYKSFSMGHTGVARLDANFAHHYNPAVFALSNKSMHYQLDGGFLGNKKIIEDFDRMEQITSEPLGLDSADNLMRVVTNIQNYKPQLNYALGAHLQSGTINIGITHRVKHQFNLIMPTDITSIEPLIEISTLILDEIPVSYAHKVGTSIGSVAIGVSAKLINADSTKHSVPSSDVGAILSNLSSSNSLSSFSLKNAISIDVGAIYTSSIIGKLNIGVVAKNLTATNYSENSNILNPMIRVGASYNLLGASIATDLDITTNTSLSGTESKEIGFGASFDPFNFASVEVGAYKNIASDDSPLVFTSGLSLFFVKVGVSKSNDDTVILFSL